jgi:hypothetical protein
MEKMAFSYGVDANKLNKKPQTAECASSLEVGSGFNNLSPYKKACYKNSH